MSPVEHYYPLDLKAKVKHQSYGYIPSTTFSKLKRSWIKNNRGIDFEKHSEGKNHLDLEIILAKTFRNMNENFCCYGHYGYPLSPPDMLRTLSKIIPKAYFGLRYNKKIFFFIIKRILTQTRGECIHICVLHERFVSMGFPWLNTEQDRNSQVLNANIILLQTVVKPFINHYYLFLNKYRSREYPMIPRDKLNSFVDCNTSKCIKVKRLEKITDLLEKCDNSKITKQSSTPTSLGRLKFIPKNKISHLDHRPILHNYQNKCDKILDNIKESLKRLTKSFQIGRESDLYEKWTTFTQNNKKKKLYAIKLDLLDAFGMVDINELKSIIKNDERFLTTSQKDILVKILSQQYIYVRGKQGYKWNSGLLQGARLSPTLCELYLSYKAYNSLRKFDKSHCFFHRTVDDMFFVSIYETEVEEFELASCKMAVLNGEKTQEFLNISGEDPCIVFCGKNFNLVTRELGTAYNFQKGKELRGKFKIWNRNKQFSKDEADKFLVNSMQYAYINFYLSKYELNTTCNTATTVLKNIFDGMCFVVLKLVYLVESIDYLFKSSEDRCKTILRITKFITSTYPYFIYKIIMKNRGEHFKLIFSRNIIKFLYFKALVVVLQRRHFKYKEVLSKIKQIIKAMWIPNFKENINNKYFSKLPKPFENISMHRVMMIEPYEYDFRICC